MLLDSSALIWSTSDPGRLSTRARRAIRDRENQIVVSLVSLWEITIKIAKGGLPELGSSIIAKGGLPELGSSIQYLLDEVREQRFELLPLRPAHLLALGKLERHHRDPFDRLIIAQGIAERLLVVTNDPSFKKYPVELFW